jgi:hypothetical protein
MSTVSERVIEVECDLRKGVIIPRMEHAEIVDRVMDRGQLLMLKRVFPYDQVADLRAAVAAWGRETPLAEVDDFAGNYHRRRCMISRLQQAPHVFHDYNFNDLSLAPSALETKLRALFEPLRGLYNALTGAGVDFEIPASGPYVHPQLIQYPAGGGFFARHWHNLMPQQMGFITSLSQRGKDFRNGGTCFEIEGEVIDLETHQDAGDICIWRYDHHHWVSQSDLRDKFDWDSEAGRWVATFAYFDPRG